MGAGLGKEDLLLERRLQQNQARKCNGGAEPLGVKFIICGVCRRVALGCGHMRAQCLHHSGARIKLPLWFLVNKW